ncbi:MAG: hypothetical protein IIU44_02505 [Spirochaetales bacterium]|nr:hypothetical protein [Spirochaetales bacterium]
MTEPITKEEQDDLRGKLFDSLVKMGLEKGFAQVELTQTSTSSSFTKMEWTLKVTFKKEA